MMPGPIEKRVAALEQAILQTEGAHYALHDLVAALAARIPEQEWREIVATLRLHADDLDPDLGQQRVEAYRAELSSIEDEARHSHEKARGFITAIVRSIGGAR